MEGDIEVDGELLLGVCVLLEVIPSDSRSTDDDPGDLVLRVVLSSEPAHVEVNVESTRDCAFVL